MYRSSFRLLFILGALLCCLNLPILPAFAQAPSKQWIESATAPSPVSGQKRLALIIGNTHYGGSHELKNPENDARAIAVALGKLGFTSTVLLDGSRTQMRDEVHSFADKIRSAGDSVVALFYYSGHGIQLNGENYLLPVGFTMPEHHEDIGDYALSAQKALDEMQAAKAQVNIAILDACRNNPFEGSRSVAGAGLAKLEAQGMLIAFATAAGRTADDNTTGSNGLYTASLLKYLQTPGLRLYDVFKSTTKAVYEASKHEQFPYLYDGLIDDQEFYLLPSDTIVTPNTGDVDTMARLSVTTNVPGAKVSVNDTLIENGSYSMNLGLEKSKSVEVGILAEGYEPWVKTVTLVRGKSMTLPVTLVMVPPPVHKDIGNTTGGDLPKTKINSKGRRGDGSDTSRGNSRWAMDDQSDNKRHTVPCTGILHLQECGDGRECMRTSARRQSARCRPAPGFDPELG